LPRAASAEQNALIAETRRLLGAHDRSEMLIQAGLYAAGSDPVLDHAIRAWPELDAFMSLDAPGGIAESFNHLARALGNSNAGTPQQSMASQSQ
jgi:flagellum-specific ATP synthase